MPELLPAKIRDQKSLISHPTSAPNCDFLLLAQRERYALRHKELNDHGQKMAILVTSPVLFAVCPAIRRAQTLGARPAGSESCRESAVAGICEQTATKNDELCGPSCDAPKTRPSADTDSAVSNRLRELLPSYLLQIYGMACVRRRNEKQSGLSFA